MQPTLLDAECFEYYRTQFVLTNSNRIKCLIASLDAVQSAQLRSARNAISFNALPEWNVHGSEKCVKVDGGKYQPAITSLFLPSPKVSVLRPKCSMKRAGFATVCISCRSMSLSLLFHFSFFLWKAFSLRAHFISQTFRQLYHNPSFGHTVKSLPHAVIFTLSRKRTSD